MASLQRLHNVCNGGHLYNLTYLTENELLKKVTQQGKVMMIVGRWQYSTLELLDHLQRRRHKKGIVVKRLCNWNAEGTTLWYARASGHDY